MITVDKQIEYWRTTSEKDIDTATVLIDAKKIYRRDVFLPYEYLTKTKELLQWFNKRL
ncbi:MAG: hypothetical protein M0R39_09280 [Prolixibacteraceae bacterium]|nr:hypothetical protein [Prolixibacteraceae bacterium]